MIPYPPLTDRELIELFGRYTATEETAQRYIALSDIDERFTLDHYSVYRWKGTDRSEDWRP